MVYQLYSEAMQLAAQHREAFVREKCNDQAILAQVLALISAEHDDFTLSHQIAQESEIFAQQNTVEIGDVISVYKLTELLGQGGMGAVFKAKRIDGRFEQTVAIKVISSLLYPFFDSNKLVSEANFMAKLNHPNICSVYDAGITEEGLHFVVMEYLDGHQISNYFADADFTLHEKLTTFAHLCSAVNYAHQMQVVHGDLKPANIIINQDQQIKVLDFGISQVINNPHSTSQEQTCEPLNGISKGFASPELINGEKPSVYSDVYALGQILSTLVTKKITTDIKFYQEIKAIINKAIASSATDRYASVSELKQDITLFLTGHVATAYASSKIYRIKKFICKRHPVSVSLASFFAIILMVLVTNLLFQYQHLEAEKQQTDVMLEKFSLVLDLDFDRKSTVELSLANNYVSRGENEKAILLYNKIIERFDSLTDTDIAFNAGQRLFSLITQDNQSNLANRHLLMLKDKLEFTPGTKLPVSSAQAYFYHQLLNLTYDRKSNNITETFNLHTQLMQYIKATHWQELTNPQRQSIDFYYAFQGQVTALTELQSSFYFQQHAPLLSAYITNIPEVIKGYFSPEKEYLVGEEKFKQFLELQPIFWSGTHKNDVEHETANTALFSQGILKSKDFEALYQITDNLMTMDFGEGPESDVAIYVSSSVALTVPLLDGDLVIFTYEDLISHKNGQPWSKQELLAGPWYHLYDQALELNEAIQPTLMEAIFTENSAVLTINGESITVPWQINAQGELELAFADNDQATLKIVKLMTDEEMIITKNQASGVQSLFIRDKQLAQYIVDQWTSLL